MKMSYNLPQKCRNWIDIHKKNNWTVNLTEFDGAKNYSNFFNFIISPNDLVVLENSFRVTINENGSFSKLIISLNSQYN